MIIHLDLDCFFVSAERTRYPFLNGRPVVVANKADNAIFDPSAIRSAAVMESCGAFSGMTHYDKFRPIGAKRTTGRLEDRWRELFIDAGGTIRGIVVAKSYEAKRYGIATGTPLGEALRLCPELTVLPADLMLYHRLSLDLRAYLAERIPVIEQYSIDEFFGDLAGWVRDSDIAVFAAGLQEGIMTQFGLPISIGASPAKWIAKLATDRAKPFGIRIVPRDEIADFVRNIPVGDFPGIGRALRRKLAGYGIVTLGEIATARSLLEGWGKTGRDLAARIEGSDGERVCPRGERRSVGMSRTFPPLNDRGEIARRTVVLARHLAYMLERLALLPTRYHLAVRYDAGLCAQTSITTDRLFSETSYLDMIRTALPGLDTATHLAVRALSVSASGFLSSRPRTPSLLSFPDDIALRALDRPRTLLRDKYGIDIIRTADELML